MNLSKKKQAELENHLLAAKAPMDAIKEIMRKDEVAKKKFEALENVMMDILVYCVPGIRKQVTQFNEAQKKGR